MYSIFLIYHVLFQLSITQEALSGSLRAFDPEDPVPEVHPMAVRRLEEFARAVQ